MDWHSYVEKYRFPITLQVNIEPIGNDVTGFASGKQRWTTTSRYQSKHWIGGIGRFVFEIDACHRLLSHAARIDREQNMRGLRLGIRTGHNTGLDRGK